MRPSKIKAKLVRNEPVLVTALIGCSATVAAGGLASLFDRLSPARLDGPTWADRRPPTAEPAAEAAGHPA
jgi:hypothetical protein